MAPSKIFFAAIIILMILLGVSAVNIADTAHFSSGTHSNANLVTNSDGTSTISLGASSLSIVSGSSGKVSYTVKLSSGTTWGTSISASGPSGFSTAFSDSSGDPTFSGTATISVANTVKNGSYTISFSASGDDPSSTSAVLTVHVTGYSSSTPPSKTTTTTSTSSLNAQVYIGAGIFVVFLLAAFVPMALRKQSNILGYASFGIALVSAIYLASTDSLLRSSGYTHWIILLVFIVLDILVLIGFLASKGPSGKTFRILLALGSFIMSLGMIADAALGLPLSSVQDIGSTSGFTYLFGFGSISGSSLGVSLAFSLFLIFNGLVFSSFLRASKKQ